MVALMYGESNLLVGLRSSEHHDRQHRYSTLTNKQSKRVHKLTINEIVHFHVLREMKKTVNSLFNYDNVYNV